MGERFVGLIRVSTEGQGRSGLGLEAGLDDITRYCASIGGELIKVFQEVESATHDDLIARPVLMQALSLCRRKRAILLVPKIDRLVRSTHVHVDIQREGVKFRAADYPEAGPMILDILVAVAAQEGRAISKRVRDALKKYKDGGRISLVQMLRLLLVHARGIDPAEIEAARTKEEMGVLVAKYRHMIPGEAIEAKAGKLGSRLVGSPLDDAARKRGGDRRGGEQTAEAIKNYDGLAQEMADWRAQGLKLREIADRLNDRGDLTVTDARWCKTKVKRALDRAAGSKG